MTWQPELDELRRRQALARELGGAERVERQTAAGKLTVRERVARLLDEGSFRETGSVAGVGEYDAQRRADRVHRRRTWSSGAGASTAARSSSRATTSRSAAGPRTPPSGRRWSGPSAPRTICARRSCGSSTARAAAAASRRWRRWGSRTSRRCRASISPSRTCRACPSWPRRSGRAPASARCASRCAHFSVIVRGSAQLFVAGPPVVAAAMGESPDKETLGGARAQTRAGAVDNEAADEDDALDQLRRFLSYLPGSAWEAPPLVRAVRRPRAPRGGAALDRPARRAQAVRDAARDGAGARQRLGLRARAAASARR